ncbi:hypothetical protein [uncultured Clostridium sp.]|uniref:hypothetical protein n=1 Tax=uncultured Clostridium sp. TaxID=59620 RepID=UPI00261CFB1C|nr:hypothetical protein [uncultured Clostridium sp.]
MIINSDITLYNKYFDKNDKIIKYKRTNIIGVNYKISDIANSLSTQKGPSDKNEVIIYIPFSITKDYKSYLNPKSYEKLSDNEKNNYFTLNNGDIIVKGIIDLELTGDKGSNLKYLNESFDNVSTVSKVITYDCGSDYMKHWKVVCN